MVWLRPISRGVVARKFHAFAHEGRITREDAGSTWSVGAQGGGREVRRPGTTVRLSSQRFAVVA
jgi:hypothetical protein